MNASRCIVDVYKLFVAMAVRFPLFHPESLMIWMKSESKPRVNNALVSSLIYDCEAKLRGRHGVNTLLIMSGQDPIADEREFQLIEKRPVEYWLAQYQAWYAKMTEDTRSVRILHQDVKKQDLFGFNEIQKIADRHWTLETTKLFLNSSGFGGNLAPNWDEHVATFCAIDIWVKIKYDLLKRKQDEVWRSVVEASDRNATRVAKLAAVAARDYPEVKIFEMYAATHGDTQVEEDNLIAVFDDLYEGEQVCADLFSRAGIFDLYDPKWHRFEGLTPVFWGLAFDSLYSQTK